MLWRESIFRNECGEALNPASRVGMGKGRCSPEARIYAYTNPNAIFCLIWMNSCQNFLKPIQEKKKDEVFPRVLSKEKIYKVCRIQSDDEFLVSTFLR